MCFIPFTAIKHLDRLVGPYVSLQNITDLLTKSEVIKLAKI